MIEFFVEQESAKRFREIMNLNGVKNLRKFFEKNMLIGALIAIVGTTFLAMQNTESLYITIFFFLSFLSPLLFSLLFQVYGFEKRRKEMEESIPDLLLHASMLPEKESFSKIIEHLSNSGFGVLSEEFKKARKEVEAGSSVQEALNKIGERSKSKTVERAVMLLTKGYESGANMQEIFRNSAEDLLHTNAILRERSASMVVEKYTLLFAGALIVPVVLGILASMVSGMDFSSSILGFGLSEEKRKELFETALISIQLYTAIYAVLASLFVANQENDLKKAIIYALVLLPLSFIAFNTARLF